MSPVLPVFLLALLLSACSAPRDVDRHAPASAVSAAPKAEISIPTQEQLAVLPEIAGILVEDRVLAGEVVLAADLLVPAGRTLTIRPGTRIYVVPSKSTKIDPEWLSSGTELLVRGRLLVEGTEEEPVAFLPTEIPEGEEVGWAGILLDKAEPSRLAHVHIRQAESGVLCIATAPEIRAGRIEGCRYGIIAQEKSAPLISGCRVENGEGGVFCWRGSNPHLQHSRIAGNAEEGLFVDATSQPQLSDNEITGNAVGAVLHDPALLLRNQVRDNSEDVVLLQEGGAK